jgi:prophage antirepressor-like protein
MNDLVAFAFEKAEQKVRTVKIDGQVWLVGIDICDLLGFKNATNAMNYHCRGVEKFYPIPDSLGRPQETRIINQGDVLRLITNSTLPAAMRIEAWIFEEVIPKVLTTGSYNIREISVLPGSKRPVLPEFQAELEEKKALNEKIGANHDLPLAQFILEALEITGKQQDFIDLDRAYSVYCQYAVNPKVRNDFAVDVCYVNSTICLNLRQNRLTHCKFKQGLMIIS